MRVVLDSDVLVAAFAAHGICSAMLEYCVENHEVVLCEVILAEFEKALVRKVGMPRSVARDAVRYLRDEAAETARGLRRTEPFPGACITRPPWTGLCRDLPNNPCILAYLRLKLQILSCSNMKTRLFMELLMNIYAARMFEFAPSRCACPLDFATTPPGGRLHSARLIPRKSGGRIGLEGREAAWIRPNPD